MVGFIDDKRSLEGKQLAGKQIYTEGQAFNRFIETNEVNEIIMAVGKIG